MALCPRRGGVEAQAVVAHGEKHAVALAAEADPHLLGLGVLADVGHRFLRDAVGRRLGRGRQRCLGQRQVHLHAGTRAELARQDLQRHRQTEVVQRRGTQVLGDAAFQRDDGVQCAGQVDQALERVFRHRRGRLDASDKARAQPRGIQFGRGQQGAEFVVQVSRQTRTFVLARGLQVVRQLGKLPRALQHFCGEAAVGGLQPYAGLIALAPTAARFHLHRLTLEAASCAKRRGLILPHTAHRTPHARRTSA